MPADSGTRRVVKRLLAPLANGRVYGLIQSGVVALDLSRGRIVQRELDVVDRVLRPGNVAIDVGANFGVYTDRMSRAVGPRGRVHAFEPIAYTRTVLRNVCRLRRLGNVTVHPVGVGDRRGEVEFVVPRQRTGAIVASLAHMAERDDASGPVDRSPRDASAQRLTVEVVTLDDEMPASATPALLKIDVEGAETSVVRGAERVLTRATPTIICEISSWALQGFGSSPRELIGVLGDLGYEMYRCEDGGLTRADVDESRTRNYVFVHRSRASDVIAAMERERNGGR